MKNIFCLIIILMCSCSDNVESKNTNLKIEPKKTSSVPKVSKFYSIEKITETNTNDKEIIPSKEELSFLESNMLNIDEKVNWSDTIVKFTENYFSAEGGELIYYINKKNIEKIEGTFMSETFNKKVTYYLMNNAISIITEITEKYNRPIFWDSITMIEMEDDEIFDPSKSRITKINSYFYKNNLLKQTDENKVTLKRSNQNKKMEQERLLSEFNEAYNFLNKEME